MDNVLYSFLGNTSSPLTFRALPSLTTGCSSGQGDSHLCPLDLPLTGVWSQEEKETECQANLFLDWGGLALSSPALAVCLLARLISMSTCLSGHDFDFQLYSHV